jgi:hypothetical protein
VATARNRLAHEGEDEEDEEENRERVITERAPHQCCVTPTMKYTVMPSTMTSQYAAKIARIRPSG